MPITATFKTSEGTIVAKLFDKEAPETVKNFIELAEGTKKWDAPGKKGDKLYDGTIFHRVIPEFMIQGGDPEGNGMGDPGYTFEDELDPNLAFDRPGRLAMANSGPNTNGSQFFITEQGYDSLNMHYTLFGQCDDASVDVVKAIARVERNADDKPLAPVVLQKVTIVREGQPLPASPAQPPLPATEKPIVRPALKP
jgi:peptidyl-prolyl cis-trans isomerase A (cyclophilin A)